MAHTINANGLEAADALLATGAVAFVWSGKIPIRPDALWTDERGRTRLVIDTKYERQARATPRMSNKSLRTVQRWVSAIDFLEGCHALTPGEYVCAGRAAFTSPGTTRAPRRPA
jgi:hypothetical protein